MSRGYDGSLLSRKGEVLLTRLGVTVRFESTVEERLLQMLDVDGGVVSVERAESVTVYTSDGASHTYTPDFTVTFTDGRVLSLECKPRKLLPLLLQENADAWQARVTRLEGLGRPLYVVTERDLPVSGCNRPSPSARSMGWRAPPNLANWPGRRSGSAAPCPW